MRFWSTAPTTPLIASVMIGVMIVTAGAVLVHSRTASADSRMVDAFVVNRKVPKLRLIDERGQPTSLSAYRGKYVVITPFLTLCQEACPLTTGALLEMQHDLRAAGLEHRVVLVEASVDPWRDTPLRLRRFARLAHLTFPLVTGTPKEVANLWKFFEVGYRRVPEGAVADRDWMTGRPLTFDVQHTDGLFFVDPQGHERLLMLGMPGLNGLPAALNSLLSKTGRLYLSDRKLEGWTVPQALQNLGLLLGRPVPDAPL
jgi:protein SCO1/2